MSEGKHDVNNKTNNNNSCILLIINKNTHTKINKLNDDKLMCIIGIGWEMIKRFNARKKRKKGFPFKTRKQDKRTAINNFSDNVKFLLIYVKSV